MGMPKNLVFVRHGESIGNVANRKSRSGDNSDFTDYFRSLHSSNWELSPEGVEQAKRAGEYIKKNILYADGSYFDGAYVSEFKRAKQTAGYLDLGLNWRINRQIVERDYGDLDSMPDDVRKYEYKASLEKCPQASLFWRPAGGETLSELEVRARLFLDTLHRGFDGKNVIVVSHGEFIEMMQCILERLTQDQFWARVNDKQYEVSNCSIIHYTRLDLSTMQMRDHLTSVRLIAAGNPSKVSHDWRPISFKTYTDQELLGV